MVRVRQGAGSKGDQKLGPPAHDDIVRRDFTASEPNRLWLTDITEHPRAEDKIYLCAIKDVDSNRIVGYSINDRMKSSLAGDALGSAVARRGISGAEVAGCSVHSDRGSQFRSRRFLAALRLHDLVGSMGQVASAGDNAAMESFFFLLQKNVLDRRRWTTREAVPTRTRTGRGPRFTPMCRACRRCDPQITASASLNVGDVPTRSPAENLGRRVREGGRGIGGHDHGCLRRSEGRLRCFINCCLRRLLRL